MIAHRGLSSLYPENTLASFEAAIAAKADMIELDFQTTLDMSLVCVHDATMKRYLDPVRCRPGLADRPVSSYTLAQIRELDVGAWKDPRFEGVVVPTLDEALDCCRNSVLLIERKSGTPEQTLAVLDRHAAVERVILHSFDLDYLKAMHAIAPGLALVALGGDVFGSPPNLEVCRSVGAVAIHWNDGLCQADVDLLHAEGFPVWVYTLNSELAWRGAVELGLDGITTDRCDVIRDIVPAENRV